MWHCKPHWSWRSSAVVFGFLLVALISAGCGSSVPARNPRMQKIRDMLDAGLPPGTPVSRLTLYLDSRGFEYRIADNGR